ncbi:MAG: DUF1415 family protein [Myxococcales bacterium]|nr:DUF1415 family protein [Myxococcales bacterium]MCB9703280.1 DUF1415 family protein [Myxococcales bacterium]
MGESDEAPGGADERAAERAAITALHERYLREVVEELNLCPFARRSREQGRVERPLFDLRAGEVSAGACADALAEVSRANPAVEVVLLTFITPPGHAWGDPEGFDLHVRALRDAYEAAYQKPGRGPRYYMVAFHPAYTPRDPRRPITQDTLVPLIRRTPDPVIQCIRADLLDGFRKQAQAVAEARFRAEIAKLGPELQALLAHAVQPDPELSSDIARSNYESVGAGEGREDFERRIAGLLEARRRIDRGDGDDDGDG